VESVTDRSLRFTKCEIRCIRIDRPAPLRMRDVVSIILCQPVWSFVDPLGMTGCDLVYITANLLARHSIRFSRFRRGGFHPVCPALFPAVSHPKSSGGKGIQYARPNPLSTPIPKFFEQVRKVARTFPNSPRNRRSQGVPRPRLGGAGNSRDVRKGDAGLTAALTLRQ
jgi:hypothetical protein